MREPAFALMTELELGLPFCVHGVGCHFDQPFISRADGYPQYVWLQTRSGEGELTIGGKKAPVSAGVGFFLFPGVPHEYGPAGKEWVVDWLVFGGDRVEMLLRHLGVHGSGVYGIETPERMAERMEQMAEAIRSEDAFVKVQSSGMLYAAMLELLQLISDKNQPNAQRQHERLRPVFEYLELRYADAIGLDDLAACIGVSPEYFCMLFKRITHMRPFDYVNRFRVEKSKRLLMERPDVPVKQIARLCGYENPGYFYTQFKKVAGVTPNDFRSYYRKKPND